VSRKSIGKVSKKLIIYLLPKYGNKHTKICIGLRLPIQSIIPTKKYQVRERERGK